MPGQMLHLFLVEGNSFKTHTLKIEERLAALKEEWILIKKKIVTKF